MCSDVARMAYRACASDLRPTRRACEKGRFPGGGKGLKTFKKHSAQWRTTPVAGQSRSAGSRSGASSSWDARQFPPRKRAAAAAAAAADDDEDEGGEEAESDDSSEPG